jgi:hypothetical protein
MPNEIEEKIQAALDAAFGEKIQRVRDELSAQLNSAFGEKIEQARQELTARLKSECAAQLDGAVLLARNEATRTTAMKIADALAESGRRIRSKESVTDIAIELVETAKQFCGRCALFIQKGNAILGFRAQGFGDPKIGTALQQLEVPLAKGSALAKAVATKERVEVNGSADEVSPEIAGLFGLNGESRIHLIPVILRDRVLALLYADGGEHKVEVQSGALEVLTTVTEAWLEAVGTRKKQHEAVSAR